MKHCVGHSSEVKHCVGHSSEVKHCVGHSSEVKHCVGHSSEVQHCVGHSSEVQHCVGHSPEVQHCVGHSSGVHTVLVTVHLQYCVSLGSRDYVLVINQRCNAVLVMVHSYSVVFWSWFIATVLCWSQLKLKSG